jgi:hypothetical protein
MGELVNSLGKNWKLGLRLADCFYKYSEDLELTEKINLLESNIISHGLSEAWSFKTLINGKELIELFDLRQGDQIGQVLMHLRRWQYAHPDKGKEDAIEHVRQYLLN